MEQINCAPRWRRLLELALRAVAAGIFALILWGLLALITRDRWPVIGWGIYVPLVPLGMAGIVWDLAARGRGLPNVRFALGAAGAVALVLGVKMTLGTALPPLPDAPGDTPLTVLHWNVRWGGGWGARDGDDNRWASLRADIARHAPDIVVLSESPTAKALRQLDMSFVQSQHRKRDRYLYRLVVASRWPVTLERDQAIPSGRAMQARVAMPAGDVRVLVVDGESHFWHDRTARLGAVAQRLRDAAASGEPIDLVAGDFNAVGRSVGFDAIADAGFIRASGTGGGWRATWPSVCPLFDIDHVWTGEGWTVAGVERFTNSRTDHRGQIVRIGRPR